METPEIHDPNEPKTEAVPNVSADTVFAFLREVGITDQQIIALMAALTKWTPRLIDEAVRETWRFAKEDQQLIDARICHSSEMRELMIMAVTSSRGFFLALTTLSMTVIGLVITQLKGATGYFGSSWLAVAGCALLSGCVLVSICYLCVVHAKEYDQLSEHSWRQRKLMRDLRTLNKELHEKAQGFDAYVVAKNLIIASLEGEKIEGDAPKKSWFRAINITTTLFVTGLLAVGAAMLI